ncbi:MAG: hypothetical protein HY722_05810 [Planctomycetes bacterium]|nr:hypothetical protein [Planctomycetota bacterium]
MAFVAVGALAAVGMAGCNSGSRNAAQAKENAARAIPPSTALPGSTAGPGASSIYRQGKSGEFSSTGSLAGPLKVQDHTATLLQDGRILIAGGYDGQSSLDGLQVYDPASGSFTALPFKMSARRVDHSATRVPGPDKAMDTADDLVVIIGGYDSAAQGSTPTIDILDPDSNNDGVGDDPKLTPSPVDLGSLGSIRVGTQQVPVSLLDHSATLLSGSNVGAPAASANEIVVVGGLFVSQGQGGYVAQLAALLVEVDPDGDGDPADTHVGFLSTPRFSRVGHTATALAGPDGVAGNADDVLLVYGGTGLDTAAPPPSTAQSQGGPDINLAEPEVFEPAQRTWTAVKAHAFYPDSPQVQAFTSGANQLVVTPRREHTATLLSTGTVLFVGGLNDEDNIQVPDPANPQKQVPFPGDNSTQMAVLFSPNYANLSASSFGSAGTIPFPCVEARAYHTAARLAGDKVLVSGGLELIKTGEPTQTTEVFDPKAPAGAGQGPAAPGSFAAAGDMRSRRAFHSATVLPGLDGKLGTADDKVLLIGGIEVAPSGPQRLDSAEFYTQ